MNRVFPCFIILLLVIAARVPAAISDSEKQFNELFDQRVRQVKATSSSVDDVTLAKELLQIANTTTSNKEMLAVLCDQVYELSMRSADGYPIASEAMALLALHVPERQADAKQRQLKAMIKIALMGPSDKRVAAGKQVVTAMMEFGDLLLSKDEMTEAIAQYQRARSMAIRFDRDRIAETVERMKQARGRVALLKEIETLEAKILQNAKDNDSIERLVILYIVELHQPYRAIAYADRVQDPTLRTVCLFANKWPGGLDAETSLALGEWCFDQSAKADGATKAWLLDRSAAHLNRFVSAYDKQDLQRGKATLLLSRAKSMREKIDVPINTFDPDPDKNPSSGTEVATNTPPTSNPTLTPQLPFDFAPQGADLLRAVRSDRHIPAGKWTPAKGGGWLMAESDKDSRIDIPVLPDGDYTVWVDITRHTGGKGVNDRWLIVLPVLGQQVVAYSWLGGTSLEYVEGRPYWKFPGKVHHKRENGRLQMRIDVKTNKDQVAIELMVSKDHKVTWNGPITNIKAGRWGRSDKKLSLGFIAAKGQSMTLHSVKVKMNSGRWKPVN